MLPMPGFLLKSLRSREPDEASIVSADTEENQPLPGMVVQPPKKILPPQGDNDGGGTLPKYYAEWQELAEAHPEVVGKELPEDIYQACMQSELPPLRVYESMMLQSRQIRLLPCSRRLRH